MPGTPSNCLSSTAPIAPRLVGIEYTIFENVSPDYVAPQQAFPASYNLFTSNSISPVASVGNVGDWYFLTTSDSIVVYQKSAPSTWTPYTTIVGGGIASLTQVYNDISGLNTGLANLTSSTSLSFASVIANNQATANQVTALESSFNASIASINQTFSTLATVSFVQATATTTLNASTAFTSAQISTVNSAIATLSSSTASSISTLTATVSGNTASIGTILSTYATTAYVIATASTTLSAAYANTTAAVSTEATARASADGALSTSISSVQVQVNGVVGSITVEQTARETADGNLSLNYSVTLDNNGAVSGMSLNSATNPGGTVTSVITFNADVFQIYNGVTGIAPFTVSGSTVRITAETVGNLVVTSNLGMAYKDDSHDFTISGGMANGVSHGAQIDLVGALSVTNPAGVLVLSAGDPGSGGSGSGPTPPSSAIGTMILRTGQIGSSQVGKNGFLIDYSQNCYAYANLAVAGNLYLGNAYVATPQTSTGYVVLYDIAGTAYKVLVHT